MLTLLALLSASIVADTSPTTAIVVAVVAACASIGAAVVTQILGRRTSKSLAQLSARLAEEAKAGDARIDYEYEAKKRLYEECEPLLFQTIELAETARARIKSLARTAKSKHIRSDGSGWLDERGYYFTSTAYQLLAPMTSLKILQRRLTAIDLSLEPRIRLQYEMLKLLFISFASDFELAACSPELLYEPDRTDDDQPDRDELLLRDPAAFARQGLYRGTLDVVVEALVHSKDRPNDGAPVGGERCKSFGEFLKEFEDEESTIHSIVPYLDEVFTGFHPQRKPVLWRVLVSQALLYDEFLEPHGADRTDATQLEWRDESDDGAPADDAVGVASEYVRVRLERVRKLVQPT